MICSMTAFAVKEKQETDWGYATWELRSVNHRYLEITLSLPEPLNYLEPLIRKELTSGMRRGKIEAKLRYKPPPNKPIPIEIDEILANSLIAAHEKIAKLSPYAQPLNPIELLRWPRLLKVQDISYESLSSHLLILFGEALSELNKSRKEEGNAIFKVIQQRLTTLQALISDIKQQLPQIRLLQSEKFLTRLTDFKINLDPNRIEQETLLLIQKMDIAEEIDRLEIHLKEFKKILDFKDKEKNKAKGKQLDFLLQELNREANTLVSKSSDAELSLKAVEMKVLIEEIREQVQNIE